MKRLLILLCEALFCITLYGCSATSDEQIASFESLSYKERAKQLQSLNNLEELGRVAIIPLKKGAHSLPSVNVTYRYKKSSFAIEFTGPMGLQYAKIEVYQNGTTYLNLMGENYKGDNARQLLIDEFNLDIPIMDLPAIMIGTPRGKLTFDKKGYVTKAQFNGYTVNYKDYKFYRGGIPLPKGIEILSPKAKVLLRINEVTVIN